MPYREAPRSDFRASIDVRTGQLSRRSLWVGLGAWAAWLSSLAVAGLTTRPGLFFALSAVGFLPAMIAANVVGQSTRRRLLIDDQGVTADGQRVIDLGQPLDACVVETGEECALLVHQAGSWLLLWGRGLAATLGGEKAWGERWHTTRVVHAQHRAMDLEPGACWPQAWPETDSGPAILSGEVTASDDLRRFAARLRELSHESGALLAVPTGDSRHPAITLGLDGRLRGFGAEIDTSRVFRRTYIWADSVRGARGDADALIVQQGEHALRLTMSAEPGAGATAGGGFVPPVPSLPTPTAPQREVLLPAAFGALDGALRKRELETRRRFRVAPMPEPEEADDATSSSPSPEPARPRRA